MRGQTSQKGLFDVLNGDLTAKTLQIVLITLESKETDLLLMATSNRSDSSHSSGSSPLQVAISSPEPAVTIHLFPAIREQKEKPLVCKNSNPN